VLNNLQQDPSVALGPTIVIGQSCVVDEAMIPSRVMCVFHRDLSSKNAEKRGAAKVEPF
jgi:hypothetical protein